MDRQSSRAGRLLVGPFPGWSAVRQAGRPRHGSAAAATSDRCLTTIVSPDSSPRPGYARRARPARAKIGGMSARIATGLARTDAGVDSFAEAASRAALQLGGAPADLAAHSRVPLQPASSARARSARWATATSCTASPPRWRSWRPDERRRALRRRRARAGLPRAARPRAARQASSRAPRPRAAPRSARRPAARLAGVGVTSTSPCSHVAISRRE
jgi:hypothetical protein